MADDGGTILNFGPGNPLGRAIHKARGPLAYELCRDHIDGATCRTVVAWRAVTCKRCLKRQPQEVKT